MTNGQIYEPERRREPQELIIPRWIIPVSVTIIIFLMVQFGSTIWWASALSAKVDANRDLIVERTGDRYTASEAIKDIAGVNFRFERNERRLGNVEAKLEVLLSNRK